MFWIGRVGTSASRFSVMLMSGYDVDIFLCPYKIGYIIIVIILHDERIDFGALK